MKGSSIDPQIKKILTLDIKITHSKLSISAQMLSSDLRTFFLFLVKVLLLRNVTWPISILGTFSG